MRFPRRSTLFTSSVSLASIAALVAVSTGAPAATAATSPTSTGPSTKTLPYVLPSQSSVSMTSLLTVGDGTTNLFQMVGIPDGLGAFQDGNYVTLYANHELRDSTGVVRAHGQTGAFVSKFWINPKTLEIRLGDDLMKKVNYWRYESAAGSYADSPSGSFKGAFSRFCSANLAVKSHLFNEKTGNGYNGRLFLTGEENGTESRVLAIQADGAAYQLPRLGLLSWENAPIATTGSDTTVLMGNSDSTPGYLRMYKGTKTSTGTSVDRAGLTNGDLSVLIAGGVTDDGAFRAANTKGKEVPVTFGKIGWNKTGAAQDAEAKALGALAFTRVEDGAFDPKKPNDYYFVTTEHPDAKRIVEGALWRLRYKDVNQPELGGTLTYLLDGSEDLDPKTDGVQGWQKPDNIDIDGHGNLVIQEDPGNVDYVASVLAYQISSGKLAKLAQFNQDQFGTNGKELITKDEETSGVIDVESMFGAGAFMLDAQVHTTTGVTTEQVEKGQLLLMKVDWANAYANAVQGTPKS